MSNLQLQPPKFHPPANDLGTLRHCWKEFVTEMNMFFMATGQSSMPEDQKISLLLYQMGKTYFKVFDNFKFEDGDKKSYDKVCKKFDSHFEPKKLIKNYITKFQQRLQLEHETTTEYIVELKELAKSCNFGDKENDMICVQISNGVKDLALRKRLWDDDLSLDDIIEKCQTYDMRRELQPTTDHPVNQCYSKQRPRSTYQHPKHPPQPPLHAVKRYDPPSHSHYVHRPNQRFPPRNPNADKHPQRSPPQNNYHQRQQQQRRQQRSTTTCPNCATVHPPRNCPAYGQQCNFCGKMNHYKRCCRKKQSQLYIAQQANDEGEYEFNDPQPYDIFAMNNDSKQSDSWTVLLNTPYGGAVKMLIDTQAQVNVLSYNSFVNMSNASNANVTLQPTNTSLRAFGNHLVKPVGKTTFQVIVRGQTFNLTCEVVEGMDIPNLLGAEDSVRLGLVRRVSNLKTIATRMENSSLPSIRDKQLFDDRFHNRIPNLKSVPEPIVELLKEFEDRFPEEAIGCVPGEVHISIDPNYKDGPVSFGARPVPAAMKEQTKAQLDYLEQQSIIAKVPAGEPTPWCSQMHVVHKKDKNQVRVCIDPKFLNKAILREYHPIQTIEGILTQVEGSELFSVLDCNLGFYQFLLDPESQLLCTMSTPWGRYKYLRLPMGLSSSPEIYQRKIEEIYSNVANFANVFDDMLIHTGNSVMEQCHALRKVLEVARQNNLTFRLSKCVFAQKEVEYTGCILTDKGVKASPEKIKAILDLPEPTSKEACRTLLGMATYLSKYISKFSEITHDLRETIKEKTEFFFGESQKAAFQKLKKALSSTPVMRYYSSSEPITITSDASSVGLGCVITQDDQPIAYASKTLTTAEKAYAMIEKELLGIVFACRKFHHYVYGRSNVTIVTDHLPLVSIINKPLSQVPLRLQKMLLKLQPYTFKLIAKPGKQIPIADALSRAPISCHYSKLVEDLRECQVCATEVMTTHALETSLIEKIRAANGNDPEMKTLCDYIMKGWPSTRSLCSPMMKQYWDFKDELTVYDGIIFRGERIMIPKACQKDMLQRVHYSHQGIVKTKQFARDMVYWKGMNGQIEDMITKCNTCATFRNNQQKEPMLSTTVPSLPYQYVSADLFEFDDQTYIVVVDHYSFNIDVEKLPSIHTSSVINVLKKVFSNHGIPEALYTDAGSQFTSQEMKNFASKWDFQTIIFSAKYSQANGSAEKAVCIAKNLLRKTKLENTDFQLSLLHYRNTPRDPILGSPMQRCMNRRTRCDLPMTRALCKPQPVDETQVKRRLEDSKSKNKTYYDRTAKPLPSLNKGDVRYKKGKTWHPGKLTTCAATGPRSHKIITPSGQTIIRNRRHITQSHSNRQFANESIDNDYYESYDTPRRSVTTDSSHNTLQSTDSVRRPKEHIQIELEPADYITRSGRRSKRPDWLKEYVA